MNKLDTIYLNQMRFYGYHGVLPEETRLGQRFMVDLAVHLDLKKSGTTDDLQFTVNYASLYELCQHIVEGQPLKLIEAVAEKIAEAILSEFPIIHSCTVKVIKPDPPIQGHYLSVAVEMTRSRENE